MRDSFVDRFGSLLDDIPAGLADREWRLLVACFAWMDGERAFWTKWPKVFQRAGLPRASGYKALAKLQSMGLVIDEGFRLSQDGKQMQIHRVNLDGAAPIHRAMSTNLSRGKPCGQRKAVEENADFSLGAETKAVSVSRQDESRCRDKMSLGAETKAVSVSRLAYIDEPTIGTDHRNRPVGTEQENRILSEKIRTMDVVGEAIGENSKPAQDSLLSPAEDEALASLRGPTKATTRKATRRPASDVEGFDEWYDLYARKEARGAAEKAYRKAVKGGVPPAVLLACLRRQLPAMQRKIAAGDRQYVPYPASWLNAERWADGLSNEQKRALCAPGSDVERLLDEALGAGGPSYVLSTANSASDEDLPEVLWNEADGPEPTQRQFYSWIASEYPNKSDATMGFEAFLKLAPSLSLFHKMRMAIDVQKKSIEWRSSHGKLIPTFADWIEQRRWNDRLTPDPEATKILVPGGF